MMSPTCPDISLLLLAFSFRDRDAQDTELFFIITSPVSARASARSSRSSLSVQEVFPC